MLALVLAAHLALTPETPISSAVIRSAPGRQTRPAIATNGVDFFAAWEHRGDVIGSRIRPDGTAVDTNLGISLQPTWVYDMRPSVVWNGESWVVVFFSGPQPWPYGAKAVEVNVGGEVITERTLVTPRDMTSINVAWNGSAYLVVWRENPGPVRGQFFDRAFAKIGDELAIGDDGIEVSVASHGGNFLVAWTHAAGTYARVVSNDGALAETSRIGPSGSEVDVASNGTSYVVLSSDVVAIDAVGTVTARNSIPPTQLSITWSGAHWIVTWTLNDRVFFGELNALMQFVRGPEMLVARDSMQRFPAIASAGEHSIVLFSDFAPGREYSADILSAFVGEPSTTRIVSSGLMNQAVADVAWSASTLGVLWYEDEGGWFGEGLRFGELTPEGTLLRGEGMALADGRFARLASNGREFAVAASRNQQVEVDFLPDGRRVVLGAGTGPIDIASDGRDYYVVWNGVGSNTVGRRVGADGTLGELHTFRESQSSLGALGVQDIVWAGTKYVVLIYERTGIKVGVYAVTAAEVSAEGSAGPNIPIESGSAIYQNYQGRLAWNGETLLYARSINDYAAAGVRARFGLSGQDFVVHDGYAELQDVVWDRGEWVYAVGAYGWKLFRGDETLSFATVLAPHLAGGARTAIVTTRLIERIPNHADQSVRRVFAQFTKSIARRRATRN